MNSDKQMRAKTHQKGRHPYFLESSSAHHYSTTPDNLPQEAARDQEIRVTSGLRQGVVLSRDHLWQ